MLDENMQDFHGRLARVARGRAIGRTSAPAPGRRRWVAARALLFLFLMPIAVKAAMLLRLGGAEYEARLDILRQGTTAQKAGAAVMQVDPATARLADWLRGLGG
ncbi:hypothetical protein GVY41_09840 [Frigidibacter albus]|uniref:Uncharacterized protein n=1 Tax=Frigidibacter albus TaxID=1465486 RepID=A0A6L8VJQ1_9RHOB|nr:hypothetical protein [Frigidibacter albus]MZQ89390.1 hypothetical protein [Frigidibacter albus]NBE31296.1 hypothetical protein [Frigidibacter albus]GGH53927.1 hypothetical protein GCM10011341_19880 [Frigidibacter albus]